MAVTLSAAPQAVHLRWLPSRRVSIQPANPTRLQLLIRRLVEAGVDLEGLPTVGAGQEVHISVHRYHDLARLEAALETFGYPVVAAGPRSITVLLATPR